MLPARILGGTTVVIELPKLSAGSVRNLELRYQFKGRSGGPGELSLEAPQWEHAGGNYNVFWQVVLPSGEHISKEPVGMTPWYDWGWQGWFWGRHPLLKQNQLEAWAGATTGVQVPNTTNRYLFGSLQSPGTMALRTTSRTHIVLLTSFVALGCGLLLIYVPLIRSAGILFAVLLAILAVGILFPAPAMLIAQAATLGVVLSLLAAMLKYFLARRTHRPVVVEPGSSLITGERVSTETFHRSAVSASHSSAATTIGLTPAGPPG
jgi:hypothetical protein